jgi:hypothetical protein
VARCSRKKYTLPTCKGCSEICMQALIHVYRHTLITPLTNARTRASETTVLAHPFSLFFATYHMVRTVRRGRRRVYSKIYADTRVQAYTQPRAREHTHRSARDDLSLLRNLSHKWQ